jgi:hypothetical protein
VDNGRTRKVRIVQSHFTRPTMSGGATEHIQVDYDNGMRWELPPELSQPLLRSYSDDYAQVSYVWKWEGTRPGSYCIAGQPTKLNRYMIHFDTMKQVNMDNNSTRKLQIVRNVRSS